MRLYLAGPWKARQTTVPEARAMLRAFGYIVDCRWIDLHGQGEATDDQAHIEAQHDLEDIERSDAVLVYNPGGIVSEGKAFEMGVAYSLAMPIIVVGPADHPNIFQNLEGIVRVDTLADAINALQDIFGVLPAITVQQPPPAMN